MRRQGPHHGAQKSTKTGFPPFRTLSKSLSVTCCTAFESAIARSPNVGHKVGPGGAYSTRSRECYCAFGADASVVSGLFPWVMCERRWAGCESPRRGDAGTSSRSGGEADGPPPPHSTHGNKPYTTPTTRRDWHEPREEVHQQCPNGAHMTGPTRRTGG